MTPEQIRQAAEAFKIGPAESPILVVDDEPAICTVVTSTLDGYPVTSAGSVEEATAAMAAHQFRLVVTDKNLPDGSGLDVIAKGREVLHPRTEYIIMTGYGNVQSAIEAIELGVYCYLQKPFDFLVLQKSAEGALARNEAFFRTERLIKELSDSHAELFRRQTELDMSGELLDESVRHQTLQLRMAITDLVEALKGVGVLHGELADALRELEGNKKLAKVVRPELFSECIATAQTISETCARHASISEKLELGS